MNVKSALSLIYMVNQIRIKAYAYHHTFSHRLLLILPGQQGHFFLINTSIINPFERPKNVQLPQQLFKIRRKQRNKSLGNRNQYKYRLI